MANNRLYLVCNRCGETLMLAKDYGTGFGLSVTTDDIAKFLDDHTYCGYDGSPGDFSIGYEFPDYCTGPCVEV